MRKNNFLSIVMRVFLALSSSIWMLLIYCINEKKFITFLCILFALIFSILIFIAISKSSKLPLCGNDFTIKEIMLIDGNYLSIYLGYFFISLNIHDDIIMLIIFIFVTCFLFLSQYQFFNPALVLTGYHFYQIKTSNNTNIYLLKKGEVIKNTKNIRLNQIKWINNTTYIDVKEDKK